MRILGKLGCVLAKFPLPLTDTEGTLSLCLPHHSVQHCNSDCNRAVWSRIMACYEQLPAEGAHPTIDHGDGRLSISLMLFRWSHADQRLGLYSTGVFAHSMGCIP